MKDIFLALKPITKENQDVFRNTDIGLCQPRWVYDASMIPGLLNDGWLVYRCDGFHKVIEAVLELKMEKQHDECTESPEPNNECGG